MPILYKVGTNNFLSQLFQNNGFKYIICVYILLQKTQFFLRLMTHTLLSLPLFNPTTPLTNPHPFFLSLSLSLSLSPSLNPPTTHHLYVPLTNSHSILSLSLPLPFTRPPHTLPPPLTHPHQHTLLFSTLFSLYQMDYFGLTHIYYMYLILKLCGSSDLNLKSLFYN